MPLPCCLFHFAAIRTARTTSAIPAKPPTIPPTIELVVGSRGPPGELEAVEVLVGRTVSVAPGAPAAPGASPLPRTVTTGTSVVEVRSVEDK